MTANADLTRYAHRKTVELTTIGRRSGVPRRVTIWFAIEGPHSLLVQHVAKKQAQWYRNLVANPEVSLDFGDGPIAGRGAPILEPRQIADVLAKIGSRYWTYRLIRLFGGGPEAAVAARIEVG